VRAFLSERLLGLYSRLVPHPAELEGVSARSHYRLERRVWLIVAAVVLGTFAAHVLVEALARGSLRQIILHLLTAITAGGAATIVCLRLAALYAAALARERAALAESEARYRAVVEHSADAVGILAGNEVLFANPALLQLLGVADEDEIVGQDISQFVHPDDWPRLVEQTSARVRGETVPLLSEFRVRRPGGEIRIVEQSAVPLTFRGQKALLVIARDVTERKQAEQAERERARLDAAMLVARTAVHELTNALTPLAGYSELLALDPQVTASPKLTRYAGVIEVASRQVAERLRRLQHIVRLDASTVIHADHQDDLPLLDLERSTAPPPVSPHAPS
jgi:PAS domain S-box-containing protein